MRVRIAQPPINPLQRDAERHEFWPGFILALIGALVLFCGAQHMTGVDTTDGNSAWEFQLVKAFSNGGIEYASGIAAPPPPPNPDDPAAAAAAVERWERESARAAVTRGKVRVNTGATAPCPT